MSLNQITPFSDEDMYSARLHFEEVAGLAAAAEQPPPPFEPLSPFFAIPDKDEFPADALPQPVADYVKELSESTQTPVDMAGTCALAEMAVCCQDKARVQCKPGWIEPLNLFCLVVATPGDRKSAVISQMNQPIEAFERDANKLNRSAIERSQSERRTLEARQKQLEQKLAKNENEETRAELDEVNEQIANFQPVRPLRLIADDCTPEALTRLLEASGGSIGIFSAEGGIFDILSGSRFNNAANIDVFLKGHAGDTIRVDRLNRPSEYIPHPALTVLLMVQPEVLRECISNATFLRRGLMARFLVSWPDSRTGTREYDTQPVDPVTRAKYEQVLYGLLSIQPGEKPFLLHLSDEAQKSAKMFFDDLEPRLDNELSNMYGWANKLHGAIMRISGIIHLAADPEKGEETEITLLEYLKAQTIGYYFLSHAHRIYDIEAIETTLAEKCLLKLEGLSEKYGHSVWTKTTVLHETRGILRKHGGKKALDNVLDELIDRGYLRSWQGCPGEGQKRSTTYYELRKDEKS